jgi:hypothetical protein
MAIVKYNQLLKSLNRSSLRLASLQSQKPYIQLWTILMFFAIYEPIKNPSPYCNSTQIEFGKIQGNGFIWGSDWDKQTIA